MASRWAASQCWSSSFVDLFLRTCMLMMRFLWNFLRLCRFYGEMKIVDPELTTEGMAFRDAPDVQHDQLAIGTGGELAIHCFPEARVVQIIALEIDFLGVHVLYGETRPARAFL